MTGMFSAKCPKSSNMLHTNVIDSLEAVVYFLKKHLLASGHWKCIFLPPPATYIGSCTNNSDLIEVQCSMYLGAMKPNDAIFNISMLKMNDLLIVSAHISIQGVPIYSVQSIFVPDILVRICFSFISADTCTSKTIF